jgi:hypothetical protein
MKRYQAIELLRSYLSRIERFEVQAKDAAAAGRIESFLNGYDRDQRGRQIETEDVIRQVQLLPDDPEADQVLDVIEPEVTRWAVTVLDGQMFDQLVSVTTHFHP